MKILVGIYLDNLELLLEVWRALTETHMLSEVVARDPLEGRLLRGYVHGIKYE